MLDEFQHGGSATHHDEAVPAPAPGLELLGLGHRVLFAELADAPEIGGMKTGHGSPRLDPAIAELRAAPGSIHNELAFHAAIAMGAASRLDVAREVERAFLRWCEFDLSALTRL